MQGHSRSPTLPLLAEVFDYAHHLFAATVAVNQLPTHAHRNLLSGISTEQALDQQMSHQQADKDTAIASILLLGTIFKVDKSQWSLQDLRELSAGDVGLGIVGTAK